MKIGKVSAAVSRRAMKVVGAAAGQSCILYPCFKSDVRFVGENYTNY